MPQQKPRLVTGRRPRAGGENRPYKMRVPQTIWLVPVVLILVFGGVIGAFARKEAETSQMQAAYFTDMARGIQFDLGQGPGPAFRVPGAGPYNQRLGYSYLPFFIKALEGNDYVVAAQMRTSPGYQSLVAKGIYPIYRAKTEAGLSLFSRDGTALYAARYPAHTFPNFESVPRVLVDTLLYIEDRDLLKPGPATRNPVIEWDRFLFAAFGQIVKVFAPGFNLGGGSTLATQIEKFRYSPGGQTHGAMDKIRQIISASLRVYMDGPDTRAAREKIVLDYLNSTPLSARAGFGEINSLGDGMWAWFGRDVNETILALSLPETDAYSLRVKATVYREALGLMLAQRRPTYYLLNNRHALDDLTDATLERLYNAGVITRTLRDAARDARFHYLPEPPAPPQVPFLDQKAANALRGHLLGLLRLKNMYELDRIDVAASSTLDKDVQQSVVDFLKRMGDPAFLHEIGMFGFRLLSPDNDPSKIKWSVVLYERGDDGNRLRVQADNIDGPLDMNEGVKLDLGSTAKLRTLVTYLEIVGELHRRYAGLSPEALRDLTEDAPDPLTEWATTWLAQNPDADLATMLEGAMRRKYSGHPGETFFTGGGAHQFVNFDKAEDHRIMDMYEALRDSVNLVFIRLMRDIVNYTIGQGAQTKQEILDPDNPARRAYLERYAEREGMVFLNKFVSAYQGLSADAMLERAASRARKGATSQTILFRSLRPAASYDDYVAFMQKHVTDAFDADRLPKLYRDYPADRFNLADRGYITGLHPLELWLASYLQANPGASRNTLQTVSKPVRIESYAWLYRPHRKGAQDTRIRILLEMDAFARIQQRWARLGYPFDKLVPSFATSIGSSADKPESLAVLAGILLNDGVRKPTLRFEKLHFAKDTPYETLMVPDQNAGVQVLAPDVARITRKAMAEVVENGTARRLFGSFHDATGAPFVIGGKTGTGDHRYDEYGAGGRLISSRVVNRTGTLVFYIGDKYFGTVTAHVAGEEAGNYKFTSALSAQMLRSLEPVLRPLIAPAPPSSAVPASDAPSGQPSSAQPSSGQPPSAQPPSAAAPQTGASGPASPAPAESPAGTPASGAAPAVAPKPVLKKAKPPVLTKPEAYEGGAREASDGAVPDSSELLRDILQKGPPDPSEP